MPNSKVWVDTLKRLDPYTMIKDSGKTKKYLNVLHKWTKSRFLVPKWNGNFAESCRLQVKSDF